jgi:diacylglycerol kinase family enzyme
MKVVLVVNPFATRVTEERLERVRAELAPVAAVDVVLTERPGHATKLVAEAGRGGADAVVVFSGDGGFNEALNGLEPDLPIGFLPGGGTSVLPRALDLSRDAVQAARQTADALLAGRTRRITVGRVNGRRFGFSSGIGLPAEVVRLVDARGRGGDGKRPGDLTFVAAAVRAIAAEGGRLEPQLEILGLGRAAAAFVANGRPYTYAENLPLPIVPDADFEHGLGLVAPERVTRAALVPTVARVLSGRARGPVYGNDLDRIEIECDRPLALHVDGEDLGDVEHAVFEAERDAVSVLV